MKAKLDIVRFDIGTCQVDIDVYCDGEINYKISHQEKPQEISFQEMDMIREKLTPLVEELKKKVISLNEELEDN